MTDGAKNMEKMVSEHLETKTNGFFLNVASWAR